MAIFVSHDGRLRDVTWFTPCDVPQHNTKMLLPHRIRIAEYYIRHAIDYFIEASGKRASG